MTPFEKPVDLKEYPDYTKYVETPMDLSKVERRIEEGVYLTPDDFEFDCLLIFENCEKYNTPKKHIDIVTMAKHGARSFKKILSSYLKKLESGKFTTQSVQPKQPKQPKPVPTAAPSKGTKRARSPTPSITSTPKAQPSAAQPATKKLKTETGAVKSIARTMHASKEARRPANVQGAQGEKANSGPVPLSVSIERVKQTFSTRRVTKNLEPWEVACARILTALSKHPWLSGSVPRFLYHVPVSYDPCGTLLNYGLMFDFFLLAVSLVFPRCPYCFLRLQKRTKPKSRSQWILPRSKGHCYKAVFSNRLRNLSII